MTPLYDSSAQRPGALPPPGCPAHDGAGVEPLHAPEFGRDPFAVYRRLRETHGQLAPVELDRGVPAMLCLGYETALEIMRRPETFSKDPRHWRARNEGVLPGTSYAPQVIRPRPQADFVDGEEHRRLRGAIDDCTGRIDSGALRNYVERIADSLIDQFCEAGGTELIGTYCALVPVLVTSQLFGFPQQAMDPLLRGVVAFIDGSDPAGGDRAAAAALRELIDLKRREPGADITSWLIAHPARLSDEELVEQLLLLIGMITGLVPGLIGNSLRVLLTDERFSGELMGGSMLVEDALDEVLWTDPPLANMGLYFPVHDTNLAGKRLRAGDAVMISFAATNRDALLRSPHKQGNRAHLAFGAGPHACPGRSSARLIASVALEKLLDRIPDLALAGDAEELKWLSGIFVRGVVSLPVRFAPVARPGGRRPAPPAARPGERDRQDQRHEAPPGVPQAIPQGMLPQRMSQGAPQGVPQGALSLPLATEGASVSGGEPLEGTDLEQPGEDGQKQQSFLMGLLNRWRRAR
ncbi:cytochrome P450 [Streptomyces sp. 4503]|uniref:Cytochrome P450 n=1 Tax=Streptomyces niphimycinicus TaxID=2842201 RepID=A0ABS6CV21_9ACTN|nr:cytochrome P450 [Streptomyces niphimycinicus]MBU3870803.1 cytochrome P450 [Streptomyces niphimycinicus]